MDILADGIVGSQQSAESAKFKLEQAEIDKKSAIALAEGQARANELLQASLTPKLVNLKWIEKWDGSLPNYMMGNAVPMINLKDAQ